MRIFLSIILLSSISAFAQTDTTLHLASDIWPPFTDVEGKKGIALDIVGQALTRTEVSAVFDILEFHGVMKGIDDGIYGGSAALWITDEREESLLFSEPYLQNQLILVGRKGSFIDIHSIAGLKGKSVGVIEDYAYGDSLDNTHEIEMVYGQTDQRNLERLLAGQLDYILVDALLIQYLLKYQLSDVKAYLEVGEYPLITKTLHLAVRKDFSDAEMIIDSFNKEIKIMISDGTYHDILELNWIHADIDGDGEFELVLDGAEAGLEAPSSTYNVFYTQPASNTDRYFVNGKFYKGWEQVPEHKKIEIPKVAATPDSGKGELKIKF